VIVATYAYQFITQSGAVAGSQRVTNLAHMQAALLDWTVSPDRFAISILIVGGNYQERCTLGELAVADVFFNRRDATRFVNKLVVDPIIKEMRQEQE
jgi:hypothetical protein